MRKHPRHQHQKLQEPLGESHPHATGGAGNSPLGDGPGNPESMEVSEDAANLVAQLQTERDEAVEGRLRALADFRNYQRRAGENEQRAVHSGVSRVVKAILPVLDHFDLALTQRQDQMTLDQLMEAVRIVRDEFNKALAGQGVERIEPAPGEEFNPNRHEAVMRQAAPGAAPNTVVSTMQAGYALDDMVLRPAKVSVAMSDHQE
jgi:molecular chaperone GrpE